MMKEKTQTLVTDQLYNLVAGFLYALSICYFAKGADFAPGGCRVWPCWATICGCSPSASQRWC